MKKTLISVSILGALANTASADVSVFGVIDTNLQRVSADNNGSITQMGTGGLATSRYGLKGSEDLGGGLKAGFHLEGQFDSDTGALTGNVSADNRSAASTTALFGRGAYVNLSGGFGEVRLGRDYLPDYKILSGFAAFGTNGSAGTQAHKCTGLGVTCVTDTRASNAVQYFLPKDLGGFYGSLFYAFGEANSNASNDSDGRVVAARIGLKMAGLDATVARSKATYATPSAGSVTAGDIERTAVGLSYTLGHFKPMLFWNDIEAITSTTTTAQRNDWGLGLVATFGPHVVRATYEDYDLDASDDDGKLIGLGYIYKMSKRTSLYAQYGRMDNDGSGTTFATNGGLTPNTAGGSSTGYELGVSHTF